MQTYNCCKCGKPVESELNLDRSLTILCFDCYNGRATEGRPAGFASSTGSDSAAPSVQTPPVVAEPVANPKLSSMGKEDEPVDLSRVVQPPVSGSACVWAQSYDSDSWDTGCGNAFTINDGTPKENQMAFCCFCGRKLNERLVQPQKRIL